MTHLLDRLLQLLLPLAPLLGLDLDRSLNGLFLFGKLGLLSWKQSRGELKRTRKVGGQRRSDQTLDWNHTQMRMDVHRTEAWKPFRLTCGTQLDQLGGEMGSWKQLRGTEAETADCGERRSGQHLRDQRLTCGGREQDEAERHGEQRTESRIWVKRVIDQQRSIPLVSPL